jgi:transaldolase
MGKLHDLHQLGQSTWLNYLHRRFIESGELRQCIEAGIEGVTANAAVFEDRIANYPDYDNAIHAQVVAGTPYRRIHRELMIDDVQRAADMLHPTYEATGGQNGYASLELDPSLAHKAVKTVATTRSILAGIDRGNTMVEVPGTLAGCEAIRGLTADGVCLNATYLFTVSDFERAAQAYICGLEMYVDSHSIWRMAPMAVASFSVGAIDRALDPALAEHGRTAEQGRVGVALAKLLYARYRQIFSGPRWERLARHGARPMRPKWTRTRPAGPTDSLTRYANALIGPDTVITFSPDTLDAFLAEGTAIESLTTGVDEAAQLVRDLRAAGVDLDGLLAGLQARYLTEAEAQYQRLIKSVSRKLHQTQASDLAEV